MPRILLLLDFDETITAVDTLSFIAPPPGQQKHGPPFPYYTNAYMQDYVVFSEKFGPRNDLASWTHFLDEIDQVEVASLARVEKGGLFKDAPLTELVARASQVTLRDGWQDMVGFLQQQSDVETHVVSVGWSACFIRQRLSQSGLPDTIPKVGCSATTQCPPMPVQTICANEIEMANGLGTGRLTKSRAVLGLENTSNTRTALHKLEHLRRLVALQPTFSKVVYAGDATTDLLCLLEADYGLVFGEKESLKEALDQIGRTLYDGPVDLTQRLVRIGTDWTAAIPWLQAILSDA